MRFTASKEAGNPHTDVCRRLVKGIAVITEEGHEVLFQLIGNHIFTDFLFDYIIAGLIHLDDAIDFTVDIVRKHIANQHLWFLLKAH